MPFSLFEKLKAEADRAGRSVNAELVGRLERTLLGSSNEVDIRHIFEALERLSARNPDMRYTFSFNLGGEVEGSSPHIQNGKWTLPANESTA